MKILWFTNTSAGYNDGNSNYYNGGGWIASLEKIIKQYSDVELGIAFYSKGITEIKTVIQDGTTYILIPHSQKSKFEKIKQLFWNTKKQSQEDEKKVIPNLLKVYDLFNPDIIQVFGSENKFGLIASYITTPVILHIQGVLTPCLNAFLPPAISWIDHILSSYHPSAILSRLSDKIAWEKNALTERRICQRVGYLFGRTTWDKNVMTILAPQAKYIHCDEALRDCFYIKESIRELPSKIKIASTISYPPYKGIDVVYKTAKILRENTNLDFEWVIFGLSPGNHFGHSIFEWTKNGVLFKGTVNATVLAEELKSSTLYVHPSYIENGCNSVGEAQLIGVTVLATNVGGVKTSLIGNKETDFDGLVAANDPYELAAKIKWLVEHPEENLKIGVAFQRQARARHDREKIGETVHNTYLDILAGKI